MQYGHRNSLEAFPVVFPVYGVFFLLLLTGSFLPRLESSSGSSELETWDHDDMIHISGDSV